jgi:RNA polymerase sigma-70 factor (ECF subfamily)
MSDELKQWVAAAKAGDPQAETRIFQLYLSRLLALAESRLSPRMARRVDADDVVQSAMRTFFMRLRDERIVWDDSFDLWRLLARLTVRKVCRQVDHHYADRRSVAVDQSAGPSDSSSAAFIDDFAREPTPEEAVVAQDLLEHILEPLDADQRRMVELRLEGHSFEEIARQIGRSESIVRRLTDKVKQAMEASL